MVTIITYAHKRPDFIYLQYESIKKHLKSEFEYIVFNNSIDSVDNYNEIHNICKELNVKCVDVQLIEEFRVVMNEVNFTNNRYNNPNLACSYPLIWTFNKYLSNEEVLCIIDSDMFFTNDIDIDYLIKDKDLFYIPQYRGKGRVKYIWNAFVCLNLKRAPKLKELNWHAGYIEGVEHEGLDVGGQTHYSLLNNNFESNIIEEYSIYEYNIINSNKELHFILNGNINYKIEFDSNNILVEFKHIGGDKLKPNKSFPHEDHHELDVDDYSDYLSKRALSIIKILEDNNVELPNPKHIGFIGFSKSNDFFILHYKSGSNYLNFSTDEYNRLKTEAVKKILK
jgi:hypothetical protein